MEILEARVIQKVGTEAEWLANPLPLLNGEAAIVRTGDGTPVNLKFGDGGKTFAQLPYFIDYSQAAYIAYTATPTQPVAYTIVGEGTYGDIVISQDKLAVLGWDGTSWSKNVEIDLPTSSGTTVLNPVGALVPQEKAVANYVDPVMSKLIISKNIADKSKITATNFNSVGNSVSSVNWISIKINVAGLSQITASGLFGLSTSQIRFVFFDHNGVHMSGQNIMALGTSITSHTISIPSGAYSVGLNIANVANIGVNPTNNQYANTIQVESGSTATSYEPYYNYLNVDSLNYDVVGNDNIINDKINQITIESLNLFNGFTDFESGYFNLANGSKVSSLNWLSTKKTYIYGQLTSNKITIQGFGNVPNSVSFIVFFDSSGVFISSVAGSGESAIDPVTIDVPLGTYYIGINITNEVGIGNNPNNNSYIYSFQAQDGVTATSPIPKGTYVNPDKILPDSSTSEYDTSKIIVRRNSANYINVFYHNGGDNDEWLKLDVIRTVDAVKFIDVWRFNRLYKSKRVGDTFNNEMLIVRDGAWENAIYTGGGGYTDALGSIHGWEQLTDITFFADSKEFNPSSPFDDIICDRFEMFSKSNFKNVTGTSNVGFSNKKWVITSGEITIYNGINWLSVLSPGWNSYLSMLAIQRIDGEQQITSKATSNENMVIYDVSTEGFTTAINTDNQNPRRTSITIWGSDVLAEMTVMKRKVRKYNGEILESGFTDAGMYIQNTSLYNKLYGGFGSTTTAVGDFWEVETKYVITL